VQASVFDRLYYTTKNTRSFAIFKRLKFNQLQQDHRNAKPADGWWFEPEAIVGVKGAKWYPGRYLKSLQSARILFAYLSLISLIMIPFQFQFAEYSTNYPFNHSYLLGVNYLVIGMWIS